MRFCNACVKRTRRLRCGFCGRRTITLRQRTEWAILCYLSELEHYQYQTTAGLYMLAGDGTNRQEFTHILNGLETRGLIQVERRWDGPRYHREPGALVEYHLEGMNTFGDPSPKQHQNISQS